MTAALLCFKSRRRVPLLISSASRELATSPRPARGVGGLAAGNVCSRVRGKQAIVAVKICGTLVVDRTRWRVWWWGGGGSGTGVRSWPRCERTRRRKGRKRRPVGPWAGSAPRPRCIVGLRSSERNLQLKLRPRLFLLTYQRTEQE